MQQYVIIDSLWELHTRSRQESNRGAIEQQHTKVHLKTICHLLARSPHSHQTTKSDMMIMFDNLLTRSSSPTLQCPLTPPPHPTDRVFCSKTGRNDRWLILRLYCLPLINGAVCWLSTSCVRHARHTQTHKQAPTWLIAEQITWLELDRSGYSIPGSYRRDGVVARRVTVIVLCVIFILDCICFVVPHAASGVWMGGWL